MPNTIEGRRKVFVSYSNKDHKWLERLQVHLKPLEREGLIELWDDTKIHAGARWREEINNALNSAAVAVLLISADFIASDFIDRNELPPLLAAADKDGVKILPVILSPSRYGKVESLSKYHSVNPPSKPLAGLSKVEQEACLVKLSEDVLRAVEEAKRRYAGTGPTDKIEEQVLNISNPSTGLEKQKMDLSDSEPSRWSINNICLILFSHKYPAIGLVLAIVAAGILVRNYTLLGRPQADITTVKTLPMFQLASADVKDTYKPITNIAFFKYRQDFGNVDVPDDSGNYRLIWTSEGVSKNRDAVNQALEELRKSGVTAVVWFLFADGSASPNFDKDGNVSSLDQSFVNDYKTAIELAEKNDLSIIWVLIDNQFMKPREIQKDGALLYGHADIIADSKKRNAFFEKALKPLLQLYPRQSPIAGWIIVNEPEVALEQGYVSDEAMNLFIRSAADIIKENTDHQAVSVGHLDLESLLKYHRDHADIKFDFYVFHHYKTYMPPSAERIRRQMGSTDNKPIYIGEFSLNEPAKPRPILDPMRDLDLRRFVNWSRLLGYAGVWPWALKPSMNEPPKFKDIAEIAGVIEECQRRPNQLDNSERSAWLDHAKRGIEIVTKEIEGWKSGLVVHSNEIATNSTERDKTARLLADAEARFVTEKQTLADANEAHSKALEALGDCRKRIQEMPKSQTYDRAALSTEKENERRLSAKVYGDDGTDRWVKSASENLEKTENEIAKQTKWLRIYEQRVKSNEYQSMMKKLRIQLAQTLYLDYWRDEIRQSLSLDLSDKVQK